MDIPSESKQNLVVYLHAGDKYTKDGKSMIVADTGTYLISINDIDKLPFKDRFREKYWRWYMRWCEK